ncbi:MAG TPA: class I SAM-dependent methyltransferase [Armatimonadota bacterium]|jgi:SAM-dependent methyltransferase
MASSKSQFAVEEERISLAFEKRKQSGKPRLYSWHQQSVMFERYRIRSVAAALLTACGWYDLSAIEALDVGCGAGGWLRTLMEWGVPAEQLHGIDLLRDRVEAAQQLAPHMDLRHASGWNIPFADASQNLVSANTVFSSILDQSARSHLASEMLRVTKPGGYVMVYDFCIADPRNPDTRGVLPSEVRRLFASRKIRVRSLNLPPVFRRLALASPFLMAMVEGLLPLIRTHRMYLIAK